MASVDDVLARQQAYYRARAPEYDDWWQRRGRYDRGPEFHAAWNREVDSAERWLMDFGAIGHVIEFAAGTGNWTRRVAAIADGVTAIDGSSETLAINREKLAAAGLDGSVELVEADVFSYRPDRRYDAAFMGFWYSHVPVERVEGFWELVDRCLTPDGRFFIIDNAHPSLVEHLTGSPLEVHTETQRVVGPQGEIDLAGGTAERTLADGRKFEIVKRFHTPATLTTELAAFGWQVEARETEHFFLLAEGRRI